MGEGPILALFFNPLKINTAARTKMPKINLFLVRIGRVLFEKNRPSKTHKIKTRFQLLMLDGINLLSKTTKFTNSNKI
jgi:hypothetical protein